MIKGPTILRAFLVSFAACAHHENSTEWNPPVGKGEHSSEPGLNLPHGLTLDPKLKLQYVAHGSGVQIYKCQGAKWVSKGAEATLEVHPAHGYHNSQTTDHKSHNDQDHQNERPEIDSTGLVKREEPKKPQSGELSGKHYFRAGVPIFEIGKMKVFTEKEQAVPSPDSNKDVDWLQLRVTKGGFATAVYRTNTRKGRPPSTACKNCRTFRAPYSAMYSFWK